MQAKHLAEYHLFSENGKSYLFNVEAMKAFRVSEPLARALQELPSNSEISIDSLDAHLSDALTQLELLVEGVPDKGKGIEVPDRVPITSISLNVAQLCNLSCVYCYGGDGEYGQKGYMKSDTAFQAVDWLIERSLDRKDICIIFFGGEPLLNFPLIKQVVAYSKERAEQGGKNIRFSITTNGTKFSDEVNEFLNQNSFAVTISFDGDADMQNKNRPFKGGKGSYDVIKEKVQEFVRSRKGRATGRATITDHNTDLKRVRDQLKELGFKNVGMAMVSSTSDKEYQIQRSKIVSMLADLDEQAVETLNAVKERKTIYNKRFLELLQRLASKSKKLYFCGAGRGLVGVSISGEVYPCHRFVGDSEIKMGSISDFGDGAQQPYIQNYGLSHPKCSNCWARYFCGGGCFHESIQFNGKMWEPNDHWCQELRRSVELGIKVYDQMDKTDRDHITRTNQNALPGQVEVKIS